MHSESGGSGHGVRADSGPRAPGERQPRFRQRHRAEPLATLLLRCSLSLAGLRGLARANEIKGPQSEHRHRSPCRGPRGRVLRLSLSHTLLGPGPQLLPLPPPPPPFLSTPHNPTVLAALLLSPISQPDWSRSPQPPVHWPRAASLRSVTNGMSLTPQG